MEFINSYAAATLVALTVALAFIIISRLTVHKNRKFPPGPKPWPIIGSLNLIGPNRHLSLHLLSKKYGGIMQLNFFTTPVVVVSSPEMAKQILKTHDRVFASRALVAVGKYASYDSSDILWSPLGPYWRQSCKIFTYEILTASKLAFYEHIRIKETRYFLSSLHALSGKPVFIRDHIAHVPLCIMARTVFGDKRFSKLKNEKATLNLDRLQRLLDEWLLLNGVFCIGDWLPILSFLDLNGCVKRMKAHQDKFDKFINHLIDDHLAEKEATSNFMPQDVLDSMLQLADDPNLDDPLCIKAIIQDMLTGGTDTTINTVVWAIQELCKQPLIIEKAKEELDRVIGRNRWVTENDLPQLPYLEAIIVETLRLHPPLTLIPQHYATEECNIAGYEILKGTVIFVNSWSIGRDPDTWDASEKFLPERFYGKDTDFTNNFTFLPFGSGRRMCPAYKFGLNLNAVRSMLANLVHGFDWKLPEGVKAEDICMEESFSSTTYPKVPLSIIMEPKLAIMD